MTLPRSIQSSAQIFGGAAVEDGVEIAVFLWSNEHGHCYDCGLPAAYGTRLVNPDTVEECTASMGEGRRCADPRAHEPLQPHELRCSVCAASYAADGGEIVRLFENE